MSEKIKAYLPWILGGAAVLIGVYLYRSGYGRSTGTSYISVPAPDVSGAQQAAAAQQATNAQGAAQAFSAIATLMNNKAQAEFALASQKETDATNITINGANNSTQNAAARAAQKASQTHDYTTAISSIAFAALMFFCYEDTAIARSNYREYTHGVTSPAMRVGVSH